MLCKLIDWEINDKQISQLELNNLIEKVSEKSWNDCKSKVIML